MWVFLLLAVAAVVAGGGVLVRAWESWETTVSRPACTVDQCSADATLCPPPPASLPPSLPPSLQIISHVQSQGSGSGLDALPQAELPAGPFLSYQPYVDLMAACWTRDPEQRPKFEDIVQQLR